MIDPLPRHGGEGRVRGPRSHVPPPRPAPQRARERDVPVPHRVGPLADLRRHPHRQLRARLLLHAGRLPDLFPRRGAAAAARPPSTWPRCSPRWRWPRSGGLVEVLLLRRVYRAPELYQLLLTFALVPGDRRRSCAISGAPTTRPVPPRPGLAGSVPIAGQLFPSYDLAIIAFGPLVALGLWLLFHRTRWGVLIRAADPGPRDGGRARRRPVAALHVRLRAGLVPGRARRRAAGAAPGRSPP